MATAESAELGCRVIAAAADRQLVGAEHHRVLEPVSLAAHAALAVNRIRQSAPGEHQSDGCDARGPADAQPCSTASSRGCHCGLAAQATHGRCSAWLTTA